MLKTGHHKRIPPKPCDRWACVGRGAPSARQRLHKILGPVIRDVSKACSSQKFPQIPFFGFPLLSHSDSPFSIAGSEYFSLWNWKISIQWVLFLMKLENIKQGIVFSTPKFSRRTKQKLLKKTSDIDRNQTRDFFEGLEEMNSSTFTFFPHSQKTFSLRGSNSQPNISSQPKSQLAHHSTTHATKQRASQGNTKFPFWRQTDRQTDKQHSNTWLDSHSRTRFPSVPRFH
jgi:hypothetical protein